MAGIKHGGQRPKRGTNIAGKATEKKFRKSDDEALKNYKEKLQRRAERKRLKRAKRK